MYFYIEWFSHLSKKKVTRKGRNFHTIEDIDPCQQLSFNLKSFGESIQPPNGKQMPAKLLRTYVLRQNQSISRSPPAEVRWHSESRCDPRKVARGLLAVPESCRTKRKTINLSWSGRLWAAAAVSEFIIMTEIVRRWGFATRQLVRTFCSSYDFWKWEDPRADFQNDLRVT